MSWDGPPARLYKGLPQLPPLDGPRTLVLAFGAPEFMQDPSCLKQLRGAYPNSHVIGCSGAGEIVGTSVEDGVLSVSVARFEATNLATSAVTVSEASQSFGAGQALARNLKKPGLKAIFVLSEGLKVNGSELIRGLNSEIDESVVVTGGLAGDGTRFQETWVLHGDKVQSGLVVAVGFYGDRISISHGSKGGWDKFGPERLITRSEANVLYELDGKPALALYKEYLGPKAKDLPASGLLFPLSMRSSKTDTKFLVRTLLAVDSVVMVLDSAKGVEEQTRKLFEVCRRHRLPILTFVNKCDTQGRDPLELIDEVESVLGISAAPLNWPIGRGDQFLGVYDLPGKQVLTYERHMQGQKRAPVTVTDQEAARACLAVAKEHRLIVEPACGAAIAAALQRSTPVLKSAGNVLVILCGGACATYEDLVRWAGAD